MSLRVSGSQLDRLLVHTLCAIQFTAEQQGGGMIEGTGCIGREQLTRASTKAPRFPVSISPGIERRQLHAQSTACPDVGFRATCQLQRTLGRLDPGNNLGRMQKIPAIVWL